MTVWQTHSSRKTLKSIAWTHKCMGLLMWHSSHCWSLLFCHIYWTHQEIHLIKIIIFYSLRNLQTVHCLLTGTLSVVKKKKKKKRSSYIGYWGWDWFIIENFYNGYHCVCLMYLIFPLESWFVWMYEMHPARFIYMVGMIFKMLNKFPNMQKCLPNSRTVHGHTNKLQETDLYFSMIYNLTER